MFFLFLENKPYYIYIMDYHIVFRVNLGFLSDFIENLLNGIDAVWGAELHLC